MEVWKICSEYPRYEVSSLGNVRHLKHKKLRKFRVWRGYKTLQLRDEDGRLRTITVHRLVAREFLNDFENHLLVDHANGERLDNRLANLRVVTLEGNRANRGPNGMATFSVETIEHIIHQHDAGKTPQQILNTLA
jgi:hypothetical protein